MITVSSYPIAVAMCVITMICWGSWGNTQKLASKSWKFQLFYWDYTIGILLFSLLLAFRRLGAGGSTAKGIFVSALAGVLMGFFYSFVAESMGKIDMTTGVAVLESGRLSPYTAMVVFALGIFVSNFVFNTLAMKFPVGGGKSVSYAQYFTDGSAKLHLVGILGGSIWCLGTSFSFISANAAGAALAYGLGQGATMVSALWGVFVWREFRGAPKGTNKLLALMFACFVVGLSILVFSKAA